MQIAIALSLLFYTLAGIRCIGVIDCYSLVSVILYPGRYQMHWCYRLLQPCLYYFMLWQVLDALVLQIAIALSLLFYTLAGIRCIGVIDCYSLVSVILYPGRYQMHWCYRLLQPCLCYFISWQVLDALVLQIAIALSLLFYALAGIRCIGAIDCYSLVSVIVYPCRYQMHWCYRLLQPCLCYFISWQVLDALVLQIAIALSLLFYTLAGIRCIGAIDCYSLVSVILYPRRYQMHWCYRLLQPCLCYFISWQVLDALVLQIAIALSLLFYTLAGIRCIGAIDCYSLVSVILYSGRYQMHWCYRLLQPCLCYFILWQVLDALVLQIAIALSLLFYILAGIRCIGVIDCYSLVSVMLYSGRYQMHWCYRLLQPCLCYFISWQVLDALVLQIAIALCLLFYILAGIRCIGIIDCYSLVSVIVYPCRYQMHWCYRLLQPCLCYFILWQVLDALVLQIAIALSLLFYALAGIRCIGVIDCYSLVSVILYSGRYQMHWCCRLLQPCLCYFMPWQVLDALVLQIAIALSLLFYTLAGIRCIGVIDCYSLVSVLLCLGRYQMHWCYRLLQPCLCYFISWQVLDALVLQIAIALSLLFYTLAGIRCIGAVDCYSLVSVILYSGRYQMHWCCRLLQPCLCYFISWQVLDALVLQIAIALSLLCYTLADIRCIGVIDCYSLVSVILYPGRYQMHWCYRLLQPCLCYFTLWQVLDALVLQIAIALSLLFYILAGIRCIGVIDCYSLVSVILYSGRYQMHWCYRLLQPCLCYFISWQVLDALVLQIAIALSLLFYILAGIRCIGVIDCYSLVSVILYPGRYQMHWCYRLLQPCLCYFILWQVLDALVLQIAIALSLLFYTLAGIRCIGATCQIIK